ncbi:hypothetical protein [Actinomadura sp. SCN-SB]
MASRVRAGLQVEVVQIDTARPDSEDASKLDLLRVMASGSRTPR